MSPDERQLPILGNMKAKVTDASLTELRASSGIWTRHRNNPGFPCGCQQEEGTEEIMKVYRFTVVIYLGSTATDMRCTIVVARRRQHDVRAGAPQPGEGARR